MARRRINGVELYYELAGDGDPLVLVHGGWIDHESWQFVVPGFTERHRVLCYDRRGHSRSERPLGQGSRRADEDDLAQLIETLGLAPAHVVANSYGGSIALGLAARRPDLVRGVAAHEPPLLGAGRTGSELGEVLAPIAATLEQIVDELRAGDGERAAARFVEDVALGPGAWELLPIEIRRTMLANAPTIIDTFADPNWATVPAAPAVPVLLSDGDASPDWLLALVDGLASTTYAGAARYTFAGAGHVPHFSHPAEYVAVIEQFVATTSLAGTSPGGPVG